MNATNVQSMILDNLTVFGASVLAILGACLIMSIAYLVFRYGWRLINDQSLMIGGYYLRQTPYKGYNRWRSKEWNIKNTM